MSVHSNYLHYIADCDEANEAWEILKENFNKVSEIRRIQLKCQLYNFQIDEALSIQENINNLQLIIYNLKECGDKTNDFENAILLLSKLPQKYNTLTQFLETQGSTLTLKSVISQLLLFEGKQTEANKQVQDARRQQCKYCKRYNHSDQQCWFKNRKQKPMQKTFIAQENRHEILMFAVAESKITSNYAFSHSKNTTTWYIDSGASLHLTNNRQPLQEYQEITPIDIMIGNGKMIQAIGVGSILLHTAHGNKICLKSAYYAPSITKNLLSVNELP
jgi:hypothetical protein